MVDGIVVNSRAVARELMEVDRVPESLIHLVYNGIDTDRFSREGPVAALPWERPCVTVGVVCALRAEKGLHTLMEGFARAKAEYPDARLLFVGSGIEKEGLEKQASELGVRDACHFEPSAKDVTPWLRAIDIFVLPSLSEALSNSLMEAMACGCCVVASNVGGNPELVRHGENGLLFPVGAGAALGSCLTALLADGRERKRLGDSASRWIRAGFTREMALQNMERLYRRFLDKSGN
jgi:glycosyltransferase involved in cell wall biosynthesis